MKKNHINKYYLIQWFSTFFCLRHLLNNNFCLRHTKTLLSYSYKILYWLLFGTQLNWVYLITLTKWLHFKWSQLPLFMVLFKQLCDNLKCDNCNWLNLLRISPKCLEWVDCNLLWDVFATHWRILAPHKCVETPSLRNTDLTYPNLT